MCFYLRAKLEVSSIILTSFRQGGGVILQPPLPPQNEPRKSPPRLGLNGMPHLWESRGMGIPEKTNLGVEDVLF